MARVNFKQRGFGPAVILLHGFPMNHTVWDDFAVQLALDFTVYTPDLPGLGESEPLGSSFSIADVAKSMLDWVSESGITKAALVGHSLGGYVALAMAGQQPAWLEGLVLFHSTAYADSPEKKESRTKVIRFVEEHGVLAFTSNFIHPLFADQDHVAIPHVRSLTMEAGEVAVKGYTLAMRDRPDTTHVLRSFTKPILFLAGEKDPGIPVSSIHEQAGLNRKSEVRILKDTGHMGMVEKPVETLTIVKDFLGKIMV